MIDKKEVFVIGAGLAGCEAAWQLARRGISVRLLEMKPNKKTPAHSSPLLGELVCSNSFRAANIENAVGLLKAEMRLLGSLIMEAADATRVPAGGALAVDREGFAAYVTEKIQGHPHITVEAKEVTELPLEAEVIVATGPLTTEPLFADIQKLLGQENLYFFDAAAPIVTKESINFEKAFFGSRYGKGGDDYINCPMTKEEYDAFYTALVGAETAELHQFENSKVFDGCMPIEEMARRGYETMRFGPLKPVGIVDPKTGKEPHAVVQLRQDDAASTLYNLVGFQTHLKFPAQKLVFGLIPGLETAEFARYGVMHRNTYLNAPAALNAQYQLRSKENIFFAGQMTGVEGYLESASSGLLAGLFMAERMQGKAFTVFSNRTAIGALANYIATASPVGFQPMNVNFGIVAAPDFKCKGKKDKNGKLAERALEEIQEVLNKMLLTSE